MKTILSPVLTVGNLLAEVRGEEFICREALIHLFGLPSANAAPDYKPSLMLELSRRPLPGSKPLYLLNRLNRPLAGIRWWASKPPEDACGARTYPALTRWLRRRGIRPRKWTLFHIRAIYVHE